MKKFFISLLCVISIGFAYASDKRKVEKPLVSMMDKSMNDACETYVQKKVLSNGMTVLVRPNHVVPRVTMQLWYNVGSKDEDDGERGIAHLIEHMIFKGTQKLSESDINVITYKLSSSTNAFTSYDYTGYLFNMPVQHWKEFLPIFADCMQNVSFKDDHLNSEMKAVIQELKLHRDNYSRTLLFDLLSDLFPDHPYHYPVIGYKQDLWSVKAKDLRAFYQKHYWPNNATLVVVGDVGPEEVFRTVDSVFSKIPANAHYQKKELYHNTDIISRSVTIYRDVQEPVVMVAYTIPGAQAKIDHLIDVVNLILADGKASRLHRKLVDELQLVTGISAFPILLFEHGVYIFSFKPKKLEDAEKIIEIVQKEIDSIVESGVTEQELMRAVKQAQMSHYQLLEDIESQARSIGSSYLATGDPNYAFKYLTEPGIEIEHEIQRLLAQYFRPAVQNKGMVLPIPERERSVWKELQKESDELDAKILAGRERTSPIEPPLYADKVHAKQAPLFDFPKPCSFVLSNGLKVLYYHSNNTPKIDLIIRLQAEPYYEPEDKEGVYSFMTKMLLEGTERYSATQFAHETESRGISLSIIPGRVSMSLLTSDFKQGMELLEEALSHPRFDEGEIEKVREQLLSALKIFWDEPKVFSQQLINETIYKCHPFSKRIMGTKQSLHKMTKADLVECHKKFITPDKATIALVGDFEGYDIKDILEKTLGRWKGPEIEVMKFPPLEPVQPTVMSYPIDRDQVTLCFAGLGTTRTDPDYDKLLLFDQLFGGGMLGSLHSKLYQLREQSGLFYNISGSLTSGASEEKGLVLIKTKVSLDRLAEAEKVIKETIDTAANTVTDQEFIEARQAIANAIVDYFASNQGIASTFIVLDRYHFPADFFDTRNVQLSKISKQQMVDAVKKVLSTSHMLELKVGRVEPQKDATCPVAKK